MSEAELDDGRRVAKIYFKRGSEALVKDIAASIRNQKSHAHLIDQRGFTGPETVLAAHAVLIQASAQKARMIGRTYAQHGTPGVEVLFFDDTGKITKLELIEPEQSFANILGSGPSGSGGSNTDENAGGRNDRPENATERPTAELLGTEDEADTAGTDETAGLADIEGGNSAEDADNTES